MGSTNRTVPVLDPLLAWLPGESLYSLVARSHFFRGHREAQDIIFDFFRSPDGDCPPKGGAELAMFVNRTGSLIGTPRQILDEHTLLRFYRIFMSRFDEQVLMDDFHTTESMLKFPFALWESLFKTHHPLKGCSACIASDLRRFGMTYWRIEHQFPGVWVCLEHDHGLAEVIHESGRRQRYLWQVPSSQRLMAIHDPLLDAAAFADFRNLAQLISSVTSNKLVGMTRLRSCRQQLRQRLSEAGLLSHSGMLKVAHQNEVASICASFVAFTARLRTLHELSLLPDSIDAAHHRLTKFLRGSGGISPLETMTMIAWAESSYHSS